MAVYHGHETFDRLARNVDDQTLAEWAASVGFFEQLLTGGELDGDRDSNSAILLDQRQAVEAEQRLRQRAGASWPRPVTGGWTPAALTEVKRRLNLANVLINRGVELRRSGRSWRGCCPICRSANPTTLAVFELPDGSQRAHCHRCGAGGDIIAVVMALDDLPWAQVVEGLAEMAGVTRPAYPPRAPGRRSGHVALTARRGA